jgi:hypothetical protein
MRLLLALLTLTAVPLWTSADEPKKLDYYPSAKGSKWEYQVEAGGMTLAAQVQVIQSELKDGKRTFTIETKLGDTATKEELQSDEKGIYRTSFNGIATDKPVIILQYPPKPGTWTQKVKLLGQDLNSTSTAKEPVEVKVAAGTFMAIPVEVKAEIAGQTISGTTWYANGVGIVKQQMDIAGNKVAMELKKFSPGK